MTTPTARSRSTFCGVDIDALLADTNVPGCSVAVLSEGKVIHRQAFGTKVASTSSPVDPRTMFQACSVSKPVSVAAALRLAEKGALDLDGDINDALTRWSLPPSGHWQPRVSLRMLASHTAGLSPHGFTGYRAGTPIPTLEQVLTGMAPANSPGVRADILPEVQFKYSGGGTTVIELLLEEAGGACAPEVLAEQLLMPAGMHDSTFMQPLTARLAGQAASGHSASGTELDGRWRTHPEHCAAGLWTTASDLVTFVRAVQDAANGRSDAILSQHMAGDMLHPRVALPPEFHSTGFTHMGLGVFVRVDNSGQTRWFGHGGVNEGFRCRFIGSVDGRGAAVMTNGDNGDLVVENLMSAIVREHGWDDIEFGTPSPGALTSTRELGVTSYLSSTGVPVELEQSPSGPSIRAGHQDPVRLIEVSPGVFVSAVVGLTASVDGDTLSMEQDGRELRFEKQ